MLSSNRVCICSSVIYHKNSFGVDMSDTIAAIATAAGNGGIGIIRISGSDAFKIADQVYRSPSGNFRLVSSESHTIHYGHVYDGDELIDEVLVSVFRSPRSFTGEDVCEISCHGGYYVTKKLLSVVIKYGARIAQPGEFTKRAFLNGRINLSQAESVIDIINAKNDFSLRNSLYHLAGGIKEKIDDIRNRIIDETAFIESALDDPEHYDLEGHDARSKSIILDLLSSVDEIIEKSKNAALLKNGITTLIIGKPNAGKSSLLNMLTGRERAIVTDVAGTTRDTIEETVSLDGILLNLIDTAGIRNSSDVVERLGIDKSLSLVDKADLILYVVDA
jgi:tRNA modification GTPase